MLTPYFAYGRAAFQRMLAYRIANWAGLWTNLFFMFFRAYALRACYDGRTSTIGGMTATALVTYITVTQSLVMVSPQWGTLDLAASVRSGQIAVDLLRPVNLFGMVAIRRIGMSVYYIFARALPILVVGAAFGLLDVIDPAHLGPFVVSVALAAWIGVCILFLVDVSSFWIESERGVRHIVIGLSIVPSGLMLPVSWYPDWLATLCALTPFVHTLHTPTMIWLGEGTGLGLTLLTQLGWAVALTGACELALRAGTRRLQVHGG